MLKNAKQSIHCLGSNILWFLLLLASGFTELATGKKSIYFNMIACFKGLPYIFEIFFLMKIRKNYNM